MSVSRFSSILRVGALTAPDGTYTSLQRGDLVSQVIEDPVKRTSGVGSVQSFGSAYAMRIWLDPDRMPPYQVRPSYGVTAVAEQNTNVTVGSQPTVRGQPLNVALSAQSQLTSVAEFERMLLRTDTDGATIFLGDVADIEIRPESHGSDSRFNGYLAPGAHAVDTAAAVRAVLDGLQGALPAGVQIVSPYDTSPFVPDSVTQVYHTPIEAVVLVFRIILFFLQSGRATLIPTRAIPVVLLGSFGGVGDVRHVDQHADHVCHRAAGR